MELVDGNRITLLRNGAEYFPALIVACDKATREIHLESYIFEGDRTGHAVAAALVRAARRGVSTYLLLDGYGSRALDPKLVAEMRGAGVNLLVYRPNISAWKFQRSRLRRLHRKVAVVDARVAFVGGINILNDDPARGMPPRFDYAVRVEGPLLAQIYPVVKRLWRLVAATQFRSRRPEARDLHPDLAPRGTQRAALLVRDTLRLPPRHRGRLPRGHCRLALGDPDRECVFLSRRALPARADGCRGARRAGDAAPAGESGVLPALRLARALRRVPRGGHRDPRVPQELSAREGCGRRPPLGHGGLVEHRSVQPHPRSGSERRDRGPRLRRGAEEGLLREMEEGATLLQRDRWARQPLPLRAATWVSYGVARFLTGVFAFGRKEEFA